MKLDILAIGAHPDDVEIGCAGTIISHVHSGYKVGIVDLTMGELGTRGSAELRLEEAENARKIMGASMRVNLGMRDGFFGNTEENQKKIIDVIREFQPDIVLANALADRHPDHGRGARLVADACFLSGLSKVVTDHDAWRPKALYHYIQAYHFKPSIIVDISGHFETKMKAIRAYGSQFYDPNSNEPQTFISDQSFFDLIAARAVEFGKILQIKYGEGFISERLIGTPDLTQLI